MKQESFRIVWMSASDDKKCNKKNLIELRNPKKLLIIFSSFWLFQKSEIM